MKYHVQWSGEHFVREILAFYEQHPDAPCAKQLAELIAAANCRREIQRRNREDREAEVPESVTLADRPFFRHWLNTGFYRAMDRETQQPLLSLGAADGMDRGYGHVLPPVARHRRRLQSV